MGCEAMSRLLDRTASPTRDRSMMTAISAARSEWLVARRKGIGGSDAAAVLGLSPWKSALELYTEKLGMGEPEYDEPEYIYWGKVLEPVIADRYAKETGRTLEDPGSFLLQWSTEYPFMFCTVDRFIEAPQKPGRGVLEIKTAAGFKRKDWLADPPLEYLIQLQHNMIVTGCEWGSFAVLIGGNDFAWCDQDRNDRFCQYLRDQEGEFWTRVPRQEEPPTGNPPESCYEALQRLYPRDTGETVTLSGDLIHLVDRIEELKATRKDADMTIKKLENKLRAAIGDATFGVLPNGVSFSLKLVKRSGYTVDATEFRQLRRM